MINYLTGFKPATFRLLTKRMYLYARIVNTTTQIN